MKKRVLALTVAMLLLSGLVPAAEILVGNAMEIRGVQTETGFDLTVVAAEELSAVLITFVCDAESGVYKSFFSHEVSVASGGESEPLHIDCDFETEYIKAFLWEGLETLRPLIPVTVFSYKEPGSIAGSIWNDEDGDGKLSEGEAGIAGIDVTITAPDGLEIKAVTGTDGSYKFEGLLPGNYALKVTAPDGMECTTPEAESTTIVVLSGETTEHSVGYKALKAEPEPDEPKCGAITVLIWNDEDGDGKRGEEEAGIAGVTVIMTDADGAEKKAVTGEDGSCKFEELPAGDYALKVTAPEGMECTTPGAESIKITVKPGETSEHSVGYKTPKAEPKPDEPEPVKIPLSEQNVWSTDRQDDHYVGHLFDGDSETYMAGEAQQGKPLVVTAELDRVYDLTELSIGFTSDFASGRIRTYQFDAEASLDGKEYFNLLPESDFKAETGEPQSFEVSGAAKYVRVQVYGYDGNGNGWVRINHLSLSGTFDEESIKTLMYDDFEGQSGRLPGSRDDDRWYAYAIDEETYTDYKPAVGSDLFAEYAEAPEASGMGTALHIHDAATRDSKTNGLGAAAAFRALDVPAHSEDYTVSFKLFIADDSENISWAGISLLSEPVTGGADTKAAAAIQLRLSKGRSAGAMINVLDSVQYNEGSPRQAFDGEFNLGVPWDVTIEVSPKGKRADITIDDGFTRETQTIGYSYTDVERVNNQTWTNTFVRYIVFNSGVGGMLDMYVDELGVYSSSDEVIKNRVIYEQDFEGISSPSQAGIEQAVVWKNNDGSTGGGSIGSSLQATVGSSGTFGSNVLKLWDNTGSDGLVVGVPLTVPDSDNIYIIKWRMGDFEPNNYSGISLSSGFNRGMTDTDHPMALQMRYKIQSSNPRIKFITYHSIRFNDDKVGEANFISDDIRLRAGRGNDFSALNFEITVRPVSKSMDIVVSDDSGTTIRTTRAFETYGSYGGNENWSSKRVDTLLFHTGAGGISDCIIDDIQVIDTGVSDSGLNERSSSVAKMGIVRLESVFGTGRFLTQNNGAVKNSEDIDPNLTRFAERPGLADLNGVSLESVTNPGWFLCAEETNDVNHIFTLALKKLDGTAQTKAFATFYRENAPADSDYPGTQVLYIPIWDTDRSINYDGGKNTAFSVSKASPERSGRFYLRSEVVNYVSDNFKGTKLNSQWWTNYPWKENNPTNDSYNFSALIDYRNVIVENGELFLKATQVSGWPTDKSGETGINYNKWGKTWERYKGRVGVVSIKNKVYNRQSLIEGSFKQPNSPVGYWNAFWLNGRDSWPPEIDIFEFLSSSYGHKSWHTALHGQNDQNNLFGRRYSSKDLTEGYHTFTLDWGSNYVKFYIDGEQYAKDSNNATIDFQKNLYLILNTGIGGWEAEPDSTMIWDDGMRVKWIRSFQY